MNFFQLNLTLCSILIPAVSGLASETNPRTKGNWPSFRGPDATGIAEGYPTATKFDAKSGKNIKWKTRVPGLGHSCPVIWGDRLFVTTAISGKSDASLKVGLYGDIAPVEDDSEHRWQVICIDKKSGKILWTKTVHTGVPKIKRHTKATHANSTPATDGKHVVAFFGSEGLYCMDLDGNMLWNKSFGVLDSGFYMVPAAQWEFGSSPIIYKDKVIIQCDVQENSFLAALDIKDGKELWRTSRDDVPTWSTPTVHTSHGRTQIIVNGYKHSGGYDISNGKSLWKLVGGGDIPVPTPVIAHDLVYLTSAHGMMAPISAIRTSASGKAVLTNSEDISDYVAWKHLRSGAYMQTPLVYGDLLFSCRDNGVLTCFAAKSGEQHYRTRLGGSTGFTASPVAANGKVYFTSEMGDVYVVSAKPEYDLVATNSLDEISMATPAISEGVIFFRTRDHVVAVAESGKSKAPAK